MRSNTVRRREPNPIAWLAAKALLEDHRKRFDGMNGPDSHYIEITDEGTPIVHNNNLWRKRRAAVKHPEE